MHALTGQRISFLSYVIFSPPSDADYVLLNQSLTFGPLTAEETMCVLIDIVSNDGTELNETFIISWNASVDNILFDPLSAMTLVTIEGEWELLLINHTGMGIW